MPRAQDVIVPNTVLGIEEVVVTHTRTARGSTRTKEKIVPVVLPSAAAAMSKSKKASRAKLHLIAQVSAKAIQTQRLAEYTDEHEYLDEQEYGGLDLALQNSQPQPTTPMEQWINLRSRFLHILLDNKGRPSSDKCSVCRGCVSDAHKYSPFYRPLVWTSTHYMPASLQSLGLALCLGHGVPPCPKTVEGIKAAHTSNSSHKGRVRSTSLQSLLEELPGDLEILGQLPTPRETPQPDDRPSEPIVLDALFTDINKDVNDTGTGCVTFDWTYRLDLSGNDVQTSPDEGLGYGADSMRERRELP
ncbi:hypothetical protein EI94DRAFT_1815792 [Lactarius quietus]|nr:hypothetical protein EI94DRAFT_1815792 [Lactarius quietus]